MRGRPRKGGLIRGRLELLAYSLYGRVLSHVDDRVPIEDIVGWLKGSGVSRVWVYGRFMYELIAAVDRRKS